jgi:hypothetical protein
LLVREQFVHKQVNRQKKEISCIRELSGFITNPEAMVTLRRPSAAMTFLSTQMRLSALELGG